MEARLQYYFGIRVVLNKMVQECHGSLERWFPVPLYFHCHIQLDFGDASQVGNRPEHNTGPDSAVNLNRLIEAEVIDPVVHKHFNVFDMNNLIPHIR